MIRLLIPSDAPHLRDLRFFSLQSDPLAFVSTFDHEKNFDLFHFSDKIRFATKHPIFGLYGYFYPSVPSASSVTPKPHPKSHPLTTSSTLKSQVSNLLAYVQLAPDYLPKAAHLAYIYELYVHPNHRGNHLATSLINHLIKQAQSHQPLEQLHLRVNSQNTPAITLYKKLGFTHIATRPRAVKESPHTYQDELLFMLPLT